MQLPKASGLPAGREGQAGTGRVQASWSPLDPSARASSPAYLVALPEHLTHSVPSHQVTECLQELEVRLQALKEAWALRREHCEESWCLQKLRQGLDQAEAWLASREGLLLDPNCGVSQVPTP